MAMARRAMDDVAGADFLDRSAIALRPSAAGGDDEDLAERMRMPRGARAGSKVTLAQATRAGSGAVNSGSMRTVPVNHSAGPLVEACVPLRLICMMVLLFGG